MSNFKQSMKILACAKRSVPSHNFGISSTGLLGHNNKLVSTATHRQFSSNSNTDPSKGKNTFAPLVICGPSGVGKGTLVNFLLRSFPQHFQLIIGHTTRTPRAYEKHGSHYFFVDEQEFKKAIEANEFVEFTQIHGRHYYGTTKTQFLEIDKKKEDWNP